MEKEGSEGRTQGTGEGKGRDVVVMGFTDDPQTINSNIFLT